MRGKEKNGETNREREKKICRERESVKRKGVDEQVVYEGKMGSIRGKEKNGETLKGELLKYRERESR